jgi:hypothetical protein
VERATAKQVSNGDDPKSDWAQGYGYQFWRCRHNIYRGDGAFGQFCIVMPEQEAVLAITAGVPDMQVVLNVVWEQLLPAMGRNLSLTDEAATASLSRKLNSLTIYPPQGAAYSPMAENLSGRFDFGNDVCTITYQLLGGGKRRGIHRLTCGYGTWQEGTAVLGAPTLQCVAASGVWTAEDTFTLTLCQYETPFIATIACRFEGAKLFYDYKVNVAFGPLEQPQLVGIAE